MKRLALAAALIAAALVPATAHAGTIVNRAAESLQNDPVYVDPAASPTISGDEEQELEQRIVSTGAGPMYLAILPASAAAEGGGSPDGVLRELVDAMRRREGTYAVVVGRSLRAGATSAAILPHGEAGQDVDEAVAAHRDAGLDAILLDFVDRVADDRNGSSSGGGSSGSGGGGGGLALLGVLGAGVLAFLGIGRVRRRKREQAQFEEVRKATQDELVALSEDIDKVDIDVQMPQADPKAKDDYGAAIEAYKRGSTALDHARRTQDLEAVTSAIEQGRFDMTSAQARLEGRPPPERRPPCFFDPRHGPSTRDVTWAPPGGQPREVPACEADAIAVESGQDPESRQVMAGGQMVPYWGAPAYFGPFAGGYFGGFGGFLPGLLFGQLLGGGLFGGGYYGGGGFGGYGDGGGGGDLGGGGDFGGGGFGGGDFGGGGGGDFGGGGGDF
jgi:hypothetical protein